VLRGTPFNCRFITFHKDSEYFFGTDYLDDIGIVRGKYYSVNSLLKTGVKDESILKPIGRDLVGGESLLTLGSSGGSRRSPCKTGWYSRMVGRCS
jgi:hypothetical protein